MKPAEKSRSRKPRSAATEQPSREPKQPISWSDIDLVKRHPAIMRRSESIIVVIDMQEKLMTAMKERYEIIMQSGKLLQAASILSVPVLVTEQYPKGLGHTDKRLAAFLDGAAFFEKTSFSAVGETSFVTALENSGRKHVALVGIETHVCVAQTALDLKVRGYEVTVAADAIASRKCTDRDVALELMKASGITIATVEAIIFQMLEKSGGEEFKKILELVK
ncbi:MAG: isochorismatase family protein [Candidatus Hydrogenedentota bacterium]